MLPRREGRIAQVRAVRGVRFGGVESPFVVGAAVGVERNRNEPYRKMWVAKLLKNGNFRLAPGPKDPAEVQQYRPMGNAAFSTGGSFSSHRVVPWTPELEAEQRARLVKRRHYRRAEALRKAFERPELIDPGFMERLAAFVAEEALRETFTFSREPG